MSDSAGYQRVSLSIDQQVRQGRGVVVDHRPLVRTPLAGRSASAGRSATLRRHRSGLAARLHRRPGAIVGAGVLAVLYPDAGRAADDIVTPHTDTTPEPTNTGAAR
jgi:hypothetical protein